MLTLLTVDAPTTASKPRLRQRQPRWPMVLVLLLLAASLIFNHGCHGADVDNELCSRSLTIRALK